MSLAALKAFQDILNVGRSVDVSGDGFSDEETGAAWSAAWKIWHHIGVEVTTPPSTINQESHTELYIPSQPFLTALMQIFPSLFLCIKKR